MKSILMLAVVGMTTGRVFAQGAIDVGNNFGATVFRAPIFSPQLADDGISLRGQPSTTPAYPLGNTVYTGARINGTGYTFGFYASTSGITTDENSLSLIGTLSFGSGGTAGFVTTTTMNIPGVPAGTPTTYQIRVWDNKGGTLTSWSAFVNSGLGYSGKSELVNSAPLGGVSPGGPVLNAATVNWTSFNVYYIPEPGTWTLIGLGLVAAAAVRRRRFLA